MSTAFLHLVSAEPARIRWQGMPLHALYDAAQNPGLLFGGLTSGGETAVLE